MSQKKLIGKRDILIGLILILTFHNNVISQEKKLYNWFIDSNGNINYLAPYLLVNNKNYDIQSKYQYFSYIHKEIKNPFFPKKWLDSDVNFKNAKKEILKNSKKREFTMINEEHHNPLNRLFIETLLIELFNQGYKVLALETLSWNDKKLNDRKFPISLSGNYILEPYFANLVRKALELGYKIMPYETKIFDNYSLENREENQANNLVEIFKNEGEKVLVIAGYSHIAETPIISHNKSVKWMARLLKEKLKIDPLTIDQTELNCDVRIDKVSIPYKNNEPFLLSEFNEKYDLILAYPTDLNYLHLELGKEKIKDVFNKKYINKDYLIQFYVKNEYKDFKNMAIPYEQYLIESKEIDIYLDSKRLYNMIIRDSNYNVILERTICNINNININ